MTTHLTKESSGRSTHHQPRSFHRMTTTRLSWTRMIYPSQEFSRLRCTIALHGTMVLKSPSSTRQSRSQSSSCIPAVARASTRSRSQPSLTSFIQAWIRMRCLPSQQTLQALSMETDGTLVVPARSSLRTQLVLILPGSLQSTETRRSRLINSSFARVVGRSMFLSLVWSSG